MSIKAVYKNIIRAGILAGFTLSAGFSSVWATNPPPITTLSSLATTNPGEVVLQWVSPSSPIDEYQIRYRPGTLINSETKWLGATNVPMNPSTGAINTVTSFTVTGLLPGTDYGFNVRYKQAGFLSDLSTTDPPGSFFRAAESCGVSTGDGEGSAVISSSFSQRGGTGVSTISFIVGSAGIAQNGRIEVVVPDFWSPPQTYSVFSNGFSTATHNQGGGVNLSVFTSSQSIFVEVSSGSLTSGTSVQISYKYFHCDHSNVARYRIFSQASACGIPTEIAGSPLTQTPISGNASFLDFRPYTQYILANTPSMLELEAFDNCGFEAASAVTRNINLSVKSYDTNYNEIVDPFGQLDTSSGFGSPVTSLNVVLNPGDSEATFYYRITSTNPNVSHFIKYEYVELQDPQVSTYTNFGNFVPLSGGITSASVDTGSVGSQTSVTITPNNDGSNDEAFINFTLPEFGNWEVEISSDGFASTVREFYGYGKFNRVSWDGKFNYSPDLVPPGTYAVKIEMEGGAISDSSLSINVSANGVKATIRDPGEPAFLEGADVNVFGPTSHNARTNASGVAEIYGLKEGSSYTLEVRHNGFITKRQNFTATAGLLDLGILDMTGASQLHISLTRPAPYDKEFFGGLEAHNSNWTSFQHAPVHFGAGKSTSDAGDFFNTTQTSYTVMNLEPGVLYTLELRMRNYAMTPSTYMLSSGEIQSVVLPLSRSAAIDGTITLPTAVNQGGGMWISVEACSGGSCNSATSVRYYGGAFINNSETQGQYEVLGVPNGTYQLKTYAPGYVQSSTMATISGGMDATVDFSTLSVGGVISGTITVTGNSTNLDSLDGNNDGFFSIWLNARNTDGSGESFTQVQLPTSMTSSATNYALKGLNDGTVRVFSWLYGYNFSSGGLVTLSGGAASRNLSFTQFSGQLQGDINLNVGATHYDQIEIALSQPHGGSQGNSAGFVVNITTFGIPSYSVQNLGTGYYELKAYDNVTGLTFERRMQIVDGQLTDINVDLVGDTYDISGSVATSAESPYNTLSYLVNSTIDTDVLNILVGTGTVQTLPANRVIAEKLSYSDLYDNSPPMNDSTTNAGIYPEFDPTTTFWGEYSAAAGTYTITNLSPGVYRLYVNPELTNDEDDGNEIAKVTQIVTIIDQDLTGKNHTIISGYNVSGTINLAAGLTETGRNLAIYVKNKDNEQVGDKETVYLNGASINFTIENIPPGFYSLKVEDDQIPKKYSSAEFSFRVEHQNVTGLRITLNKTAKITGQIRLIPSGILISQQNYDSFLSNSFRVEARANPWFQGGFHEPDYPLIDSSGRFNVNTNPGTFDLLLRSSGFIGDSNIAQGQKQLVPKTVSGIKVRAGETKDLGIIEMVEGQNLTGTVKNDNGTALANILVTAEEAFAENHDVEPLSAYTNENGEYTIYGIDPGTAERAGARYYNVYAAKRPRGAEDFVSSGNGTKYGEVRKYVDTRSQTSGVNFTLQVANGGIRGRVKTPDNGPINNPFRNSVIPGAEIIANKSGDIPIDNPIGDISVLTEPNGNFLIDALVPGSYKVVGLAAGYGSALKRDIIVGNSIVNIGTITFTTGFKLSGEISLPDGSAPNTSQVETLIAVRNGFEEVLIGSVETDASNIITSYAITGFQSGKTYRILALAGQSDDLFDLGSATLTADEDRDFAIRPKAPDIFASAFLETNNAITIKFEFGDALSSDETDLDDNDIPDNSDPDNIFTVTNGEQSRLTSGANWLSSNRKRAELTYTPAAGETSFTIRTAVDFTEVNPETGDNFSKTKSFTFFIGIKNQKSKKLLNASAGSVEFSDDGAGFTSSPGTFGYDDSSLEVEVVLRKAVNLNDVVSSQLDLGSSNALEAASLIGFASYPSEMRSAMVQAQAADLNPLSSFYDIFLPAGVNHFFPEGAAAQICLAYDDSVTNPSELNIYYYNESTNEYLLENANRALDEENQLVCAEIAHASVFTIFASSDSVLTGAGYTGPLTVMSFPNPFNLQSKTVELQDPGSLSTNQTIQGTMIKLSVPTGMDGSTKIEIFNVAGELVRTINTAITGGSHNYIEWDGTNDSGRKVASGLYIARMTINGSNEKFFKMAVVK